MDVGALTLILDRIAGWNVDFHLHGFGEPLLDRNLVEKVSLVRTRFPNASISIISTLGVRKKSTYFHELVDAGLSSMIVSMYGFTPEEYTRVHGADKIFLVKENLTLLSDAVAGTDAYAVVKIPAQQVSGALPVAVSPERMGFIAWAKQRGLHIGEMPYVHNYSNGRAYNPASEKMCPVVDGKRKEILNITWDLKVIPCCYDFNATIPFGDLRTQSVDEIFSSKPYIEFVSAHKKKNLSAYSACAGCEKLDYS